MGAIRTGLCGGTESPGWSLNSLFFGGCALHPPYGSVECSMLDPGTTRVGRSERVNGTEMIGGSHVIGGATLRNSKAAQKSTGPTSEAGKKRSSQNAVKHGLTAKTVMLPGESVAEFQQKLTGLFDGLKPRDPFEVALVERAGYLQWQIDRCGRAESARLWERAYSRAVDERNRVEQEVTGLLQTLLRAPEGGRRPFHSQDNPQRLKEPARTHGRRRLIMPTIPRECSAIWRPAGMGVLA